VYQLIEGRDGPVLTFKSASAGTIFEYLKIVKTMTFYHRKKTSRVGAQPVSN
jgi:hypothetical protein